MLVLSSEIIIGQYKFNQIVNVEIESSYESFTDTCTITIPRKLSFQGKSLIVSESALFKKGDKVTVKLGYGFSRKEIVFTGYLLKIESGTPTRLICEDGAYLLKETKAFNLVYPKLKIEDLLKDIVPSSIPFEAVDIELGKARFVKLTASQILNYLKDKFGIKSWFRNDKLYVGLNYFPSLQRTWKFEFQRNIIGDSLQFVKADDIKVKVKAISILPDNTRIEYETGDSDGSERTIHYYNVTSKTELEKRAKDEIKNFKFDGFTGSFSSFGYNVNHGDIVELIDKRYPEKDGKYIVKSVRRMFGNQGYSIDVELADKV